MCKIQHVEEVVQAMKEITTQLNTKLSGEQNAEMCGIYNFTPSRSPRVDKIWQYTGTGIKKTPVDIYIPDDLDPVEINQFMTDMGMESAANIEPLQPASYAVSPLATFCKKGKTPVQLEGPKASVTFWSKYRQQKMEAAKEVPKTPTRPTRPPPRQTSPTTVIVGSHRQQEMIVYPKQLRVTYYSDFETKKTKLKRCLTNSQQTLNRIERILRQDSLRWKHPLKK